MPKWSKIKTKYKMFLYGTYVAARNSSLAVLGHFSKSVVIVLKTKMHKCSKQLINSVNQHQCKSNRSSTVQYVFTITLEVLTYKYFSNVIRNNTEISSDN